MWHVGIDLHRESLTLAAMEDDGRVGTPERFSCSQTEAIVAKLRAYQPFRAVIEATATYRWLYELLSPHGVVVLAHPLRLRAMVLRRSKTDRLDAQLLAQLLRMDQIPLSYIPDDRIQFLRELTRYRTSLSRDSAKVKVQLRHLLAVRNMRAPYKWPFGPRGLYWFSRQDFGAVGNCSRDHLLERLARTKREIEEVDGQLEAARERVPEVEALTCLRGIGLFTAMTIVAEFGEVRRFRKAKQAAAYSGLTTRVFQSGNSDHRGHISKQGSPWLRWVLIEASMKLVTVDAKLGQFYQRIRRRSGAKLARVAAARKLAEICWKRLCRWHQEHPALAA